MAKRFGRNQRRQMRERIGDLEGVIDGMTALVKKAADARDMYRNRLDSWADEILHLVGDNSAFLETLSQMGMPQMGSMRFPDRTPLRVRFAMLGAGDHEITMSTIRAFVYTLETRFEAIDRRIYVRLMCRDDPERQLAMALDERMFANPSPRMVQDMAIMVAKGLAEAMGRPSLAAARTAHSHA
jgi:hypothetical protein